MSKFNNHFGLVSNVPYLIQTQSNSDSFIEYARVECNQNKLLNALLVCLLN